MSTISVTPPVVAARPRFARVRESIRFFVRWFATFPVLGFAAALLVGFVAFDLVAGFGIPDLFWRLTAWKMLLVGASVAGVFALICFVGYLLESYSNSISPAVYFVRIYPVLTLLYLFGAARSDYEPGVNIHYARPWVGVVGYAIGVVLVLLMAYVIVPAIWRFATAIAPNFVKARVEKQYEQVSNPAQHGYAAIVMAILALAYLLLSVFLPRIPAATAICIVFSIVVMTYGFVRFVAHDYRFGVLLIVVLISGIVNFASPYKHRYPQYGAAYAAPAAIPPSGGNPNSSLISNKDAFDAWVKSAHTGAEKPRLAIIATSGGGIRAAVWTASVLKRLSAGDIEDFPTHIRVITGASGGMLGAAFYVGSLRQKGENQVINFSEMAADSLEPVALALALRDAPALLIPGHFADRGVALEEAWERNAEVMRTPLGKLAPGERAGWRPSLIFTPVFVEDGRRALVSNLDLSFLSKNSGPQIGEGMAAYSIPAVELQRVLPSTSKLSLASISRMSASFPYVASAAEIPTNPRRHLVDAGYWDNYGVSVAVAWLAQNFQRVAAETSGVVLIQIRDTVQQPANLDASRPAKPGLPLAGFSEFVAPVIGALRARESVMMLRNDNDVQQIANAFNQTDKQFFTTVVLENPETSVLSWSLTDKQAADMLDYFDKHADGVPSGRVKALRAWWNAPRAAATMKAMTAVLP